MTADPTARRRALLAAAALATAVALVRHLSMPEAPPWDGGSIERLFIADQPPLRGLLRPRDARHPGLWPAVLHAATALLGGERLSVAHLLGRAFAVATVPLTGLVVARSGGVVGAALAMLAVALVPPMGLQAQDVSDTTMFTALGLAALAAHQRAVERPSAGASVAAGVVLGLALQTSFSAAPLALALALHALWARGRAAWPELLAAAAVASTALVQLVGRLPSETAMKRDAASSAWLTWPKTPFATYLAHAEVELLGYTAPLAVLAALVVGVVVGAARLGRTGALPAVVLAYTGALALQPFLPVKPYYVMFLPIAAVTLLGALVPPDLAGWRGRATALALAVVVAGFGTSTWWSRPGLIGQLQARRWAAVEAARDDGATVLVLGFPSDWTGAVYHLFDDPFGAMRRRYAEPDAGADTVYRDPASSRTVRLLTTFPFRDGWEADAFARVDALRAEGPVHLLLNERFLPDSLAAWAAAHCARLEAASALQAWRCPPEPSPAGTP